VSVALRVGLLLVALLAVVIAMASPARTASAHAVLVRSEPAADARLTAPPAEIRMWFSEPLEPAFSGARLLRATGEEVIGAAVRFDSGDGTRMSLGVDALVPGFYTVAWHTLSPVDGHEWRGNFTFVVLNADGSTPAGSAFVVGGMGGTDAPSWAAVSARWLSLGGALALVGMIAVALMLARPAPAAPLHASPVVANGLAARLTAIGVLAAASALLGGLLQLGLDLDRLGGLAVADRFLLDTRTGHLWLARQLLSS
jgi:hypothetical protein